MTQIIKPEKKTPEVADILHHHLDDYKAEYSLWPEHRKIVSDLLNCRTAHLGGHIERCDACGAVRITYHSCRNRHCPKCQHMPRERWLEKRKDEILPVSYFHVVFTLPHELNTAILNNKKVMLNCLFAAASKTLLTFGNNQLNGTLGFLAVLHTWDQKLNVIVSRKIFHFIYPFRSIRVLKLIFPNRQIWKLCPVCSISLDSPFLMA